MSTDAPFDLRLSVLEEGVNEIDLAGTADDLGVGTAELRLAGPVTVTGTAWRSGFKVEVQGVIEATFDLACDRCLEPFRSPIRVPLRVFAERQESRDRRTPEEVREEDPGIVYHHGQSVSLTDEVRQILLVEAPWQALCRRDCAGLCPVCGANRNLGRCPCRQAGDDPR